VAAEPISLAEPYRSPVTRLVPFRPEHAASIVSWIRNDRELFLIAPRTPPPLTVAKVCGWTGEGDRPVVLTSGARPVGYAELNRLDHLPAHLWIGHFVIDPELRRRGYGSILLSGLLSAAFASPDVWEVSLTVFPQNVGAIAFYEWFGFVLHETQVRRFEGTGRRHRIGWMRLPREQFERGRHDGAEMRPTP
jgi:RimJ/RimL family protein N-acetyltransferase